MPELSRNLTGKNGTWLFSTLVFTKNPLRFMPDIPDQFLCLVRPDPAALYFKALVIALIAHKYRFCEGVICVHCICPLAYSSRNL